MIHTSSIQTIFDKNYIDQLHFGGAIKTYVIPCKYNQADPYKSVNGEYFVLFCVPPKKLLKFYTEYDRGNSINNNFTLFMKRFIQDYIQDLDKTTMVLFKVTTTSDLVYIGTYQYIDYGKYNNLQLSLFNPNQLIIDAFNNVTGIYFPSNYNTIDFIFSSVNFTIKLIRYLYSNDSIYLNKINRISNNYSLGGSNLVSDNTIPKKYITQNVYNVKSVPISNTYTTSTYGIPIYYTEDGIVFNLKKIYTQSQFQVMLPNYNNLQQLIVIHKYNNNELYLDFYDSDSTVESISIGSVYKTVEWINDNKFQITLQSVNKMYECEFNQTTKTFINFKEISDIVSNYTVGNISNFIYNGIWFCEDSINAGAVLSTYTSDEYYASTQKNTINAIPNTLTSKQIKMNGSIIDISQIREMMHGSFIQTNEGINFSYYSRLYISNNKIQQEGEKNLNLKNISPLYFEIGNWVIIPNYNILLPNSKDLLKSYKIRNGNINELTYIYTLTSDINTVEIVDVDNILKSVEGNVIKINDIDSTTKLYSFNNLMILDVPLDTTSSIEVIHHGITNNFLYLENLQKNTSANKKFIMKNNIVDLLILDNIYKKSFLITYNEMINFIDNDIFIKLTNTDSFYLTFCGKPITDILDFKNNIFTYLKDVIEYDTIDLENLANVNNTFISNLITSQNTVQKTLSAIVVDGINEYTLCEFPYKKIKSYSNLTPVINSNIATYNFSHFIDEDGTIYAKETIDFITACTNNNIFDIKLLITTSKTILDQNGNNEFTSINYSLDTFINCEPFYKPLTNYENIIDTSEDILNVSYNISDSTILNLTAVDNVNHTFELDLSGLELNDFEEISINITCDSTGNISNDIGKVNIFDNVLNNDGISISLNNVYSSTIYYDYISKDLEKQDNETNLINFDIYQYGEFSNKCILFTILTPTSDIDIINCNTNRATKYVSSSTQGINFYEDLTTITAISDQNIVSQTLLPVLCYVTRTLGAAYYIDINKLCWGSNKLYSEQKEDNYKAITNITSAAVTWLSNYSLDYFLNINMYSIFNQFSCFPIPEISPHFELPILFNQYDSFFGIILKDRTTRVTDQTDCTSYYYLGTGNSAFYISNSKFYGIKLSDLPIGKTNLQNTNSKNIELVLNGAKKGTPQAMSLLIDNTSYNNLITEIKYDTTETIPFIPPEYTKKVHIGLNGLHKDYMIYFNYELTPDELMFVKGTGKYDIAKMATSNVRKQCDETLNNVITSKNGNTLNDISRKYLNITITSQNIYINNYAYYTGGNVIEKLRFFGNRQFGDKHITILKTTNVLSGLTQTFC